jgi:hypothetical protein
MQKVSDKEKDKKEKKCCPEIVEFAKEGWQHKCLVRMTTKYT